MNLKLEVSRGQQPGPDYYVCNSNDKQVVGYRCPYIFSKDAKGSKIPSGTISGQSRERVTSSIGGQGITGKVHLWVYVIIILRLRSSRPQLYTTLSCPWLGWPSGKVSAFQSCLGDILVNISGSLCSVAQAVFPREVDGTMHICVQVHRGPSLGDVQVRSVGTLGLCRPVAGLLF